MKKTIVLCLLVILIFTITACGGNKIPENLTDVKWYFYDEDLGEHLVLRLGSDGSFTYSCQCGEPVGDSDLYDSYTYDGETGNIVLNGGDESMEIKVISHNEAHLLVEIDGDVKDFGVEEFALINTDFTELADYLQEYDSYSSVVKVADGVLTASHPGYDPQGDWVEDGLEEYAMAENITFYELNLRGWVDVEDGEIVDSKVEVGHYQVPDDVIADMADGCALAGFLWFNENLEVEHVLFFGETQVQE